MRLVFVHGINNQDNSATAIERDWWNAIVLGWTNANLSLLPRPHIDTAFYGDILVDTAQIAAQTMGVEAPECTTNAFAFLHLYSDHLGLTPTQLDNLSKQVDPNYQWQEQGLARAALVKLAQAIASVLPDNGRAVASAFLQQAVVYIDQKGVRDRILSVVRSQVFENKPDPTIVIAHSLGTVVCYNLLVDQGLGLSNRNITLFLTLGSPLGIGMMDRITPPRASFPLPPIGRWVNGRRADDFVPLDADIDNSNLGFSGVDNIHTTMVDGVDPHSIDAYLGDGKIARLLHAALE